MAKFFLGLLLIIVILLLGLGFYLDSRGHLLIADFLTKRLGTPVSIEHAELSWGSLALDGIAVQNPQSHQPALSVKRVMIDFKPQSLLSSVVVLPQVTIEEPVLSIELLASSQATNWDPLIKEETPTSDSPAVATPTASKKVEIDRLVLSHLAIHLQAKETALPTLPVPVIDYLQIDHFNPTLPLSPEKALQLILYTTFQAVIKLNHLEKIFPKLPALPADVEPLWQNISLQLPAKSSEPKKTWQAWTESLGDEVKEGWKHLKEFFQSKGTTEKTVAPKS